MRIQGFDLFTTTTSLCLNIEDQNFAILLKGIFDFIVVAVAVVVTVVVAVVDTAVVV